MSSSPEWNLFDDDDDAFETPAPANKRPNPEEQDRAQSQIEAKWGASASAAWNATYEEVQITWEKMKSNDIKVHQWGETELECCWEVQLAANNGRPTKEIHKTKQRRTKIEIKENVPKKGRARTRAYCTHIALRAVQNFPLPQHKVTDASHLCHNPKCVRPEHIIIVESRKSNHARKNCLHKIDCPCCEEVILVCKHQPPCIHPGSW